MLIIIFLEMFLNDILSQGMAQPTVFSRCRTVHSPMPAAASSSSLHLWEGRFREVTEVFSIPYASAYR